MPYQGGQRGSKNTPKAANIFQIFSRPAAAKPATSAFVPISSDQLPAGAFMRETGRVGGMTSEDAGRLGGYMDDYGRVFVPASTRTKPSVPVVPSPLFQFPTKTKQTSPVVPASATVFAPVSVPAGTVGSGTTIVTGLTSTGEVDRSQSDEYKSQLAQYQNLIKKQQTQEAEDLGMKAWSQKYGQTPMGQAGGAIGVYNPLLATTFPDATNPGYPAFVPAQELAQGDLGTRAQGELGPTMESLNPMAAQAAQQTATAQQADKATTVKLPVRNRVNMFLYGGM
jgi:hypothetical protein